MGKTDFTPVPERIAHRFEVVAWLRRELGVPESGAEGAAAGLEVDPRLLGKNRRYATDVERRVVAVVHDDIELRLVRRGTQPEIERRGAE